MNLFDKTKVYPLPMTPDYIRHWSVKEAVRELIQNAIDSSSPFKFTIENENVLYINSEFETLSHKSLALGMTSKADKPDKIGSFGEGYKLALLVLTREGKQPVIYNGDRIWSTVFKHDSNFECEILHVIDSPLGKSVRPMEGLTFVINHLTPEEIEDIKSTCLMTQEGWMEGSIVVKKGTILPARPGKLYVGGLYVSDTELKFGYDIRPEYLSLERDRQTVSSIDLKFLTKEMWFDTEQYDTVAELMAEKIPDLDYAEYGCPDMVKEACYRHFQEQHPGAIVAESQKELDELVKKGMSRVVYLGGGGYSSAVRSSRGYQDTVRVNRAVQTPYERLKYWYENNKKYMPRLPQVSIKEILREAENWRLR